MKLRNAIFSNGDYNRLISFSDNTFPDPVLIWNLSDFMDVLRNKYRVYRTVADKILNDLAYEFKKDGVDRFGIEPGHPNMTKYVEAMSKIDSQEFEVECNVGPLTVDSIPKGANPIDVSVARFVFNKAYDSI